MREKALKILSEYFKAKGFRKKGQTWYFFKENVALMVEYQGSDRELWNVAFYYLVSP